MTRIIKLFICLTAGYFIGTLNPAALLARIKKKDLRKSGTGNLGATNAMLVLGKACGAVVMAFDIAKAFLAVRAASFFFHDLSLAGIVAGAGAVIGHIFPFYLKFKGGKGLAPYAGMVLALDPLLFLFLLILCVIIMLIVNYGVGLVYSAGILFPLLSLWRNESIGYFIIAVSVSALLLAKHFENIKKILKGEDYKVRDVIKNMFSKAKI